MTIISAWYPPITSAAIEKLTKEFNVLVISIKAVNKKLKINYQISGSLIIFRSV